MMSVTTMASQQNIHSLHQEFIQDAWMEREKSKKTNKFISCIKDYFSENGT